MRKEEAKGANKNEPCGTDVVRSSIFPSSAKTRQLTPFAGILEGGGIRAPKETKASHWS